MISVTSVRSARQLIDVLRAQAADIDIILAEVDLPVAKGFKMLKYITRDKDLRRIPIISMFFFFFPTAFPRLWCTFHVADSYRHFCLNKSVMSSQDEVSVVVKCLRLGPADYLVKPLRTNELLNLWTHMWRRRRTVLNCLDLLLHCLMQLEWLSSAIFAVLFCSLVYPRKKSSTMILSWHCQTQVMPTQTAQLYYQMTRMISWREIQIRKQAPQIIVNMRQALVFHEIICLLV